MCEEVHFSRVASLHAYSQQLYQQMNSFTAIFQRLYLDFKNAVLSPPMLPHALTQAPATNFEDPLPPPPSPHVLNTCGKLLIVPLF